MLPEGMGHTWGGRDQEKGYVTHRLGLLSTSSSRGRKTTENKRTEWCDRTHKKGKIINVVVETDQGAVKTWSLSLSPQLICLETGKIRVYFD